MANIHNILSFTQPSRLFYRNFSSISYTSSKSVPLNFMDISKPNSNSFFNKSNLLFNCRYTRNFGSSVSKVSAAPSLSNDKPSKLYAPYVYEEVKAPYGGGPIYWKTRKFLMIFKRRLFLRARERRWNWDYIRSAFSGVPKLSYDPKINQWIPLMDNEEWGGVGGRFWIDISNTVLLNLLFAYILYAIWYRLVANNKHNVFARWKNKEGEEDEE